MVCLDFRERFVAIPRPNIEIRPAYSQCAPCSREPCEIVADGEGFDSVDVTHCQENSLEQTPNQREAESEAVGPDSDLKTVIEAWPRLPEAIKAGILAMIVRTVE